MLKRADWPLLYIGYFKISVQNTSASLIDKDVLIIKENVIENNQDVTRQPSADPRIKSRSYI